MWLPFSVSLTLFLSLVSAGVETTCKEPKTWAFTLDDGPSTPFSPKILDILKAHNVKATFFVVGAMLQSPDKLALIQRAVNEGHLIASHTMTHRSLPSLSDWEIHNEIQGVDQLVHGSIGKTPAFIRPPYGDVDHRVLSIASQFGKTVVNWNVDSDDWRHPGNPEAVLNNFRQALSNPALTSAISLSHEIHEVTVNTMARTFDLIKAHGYRLVRLDECLQMPGYLP